MEHGGTIRRMRLVGTPLLLLIVLILGACGSGDEEVSDDAVAATSAEDSADAADGSDSDGAESDDAGSTDFGGDDFSIPSPDGMILDALESAGISMDSQRQLYYPNDDFDRIVAFYDDWIGSNGEWSKAEAEGTVVYQDISGNGIRQITISPDQDPGAQAEGPATFVILVAS